MAALKEMAYTQTLVLFVNGVKVEVKDPDPEMTLLEFLRKKLRLTGSKLGCGEGGCGACTVMVSRYHEIDDIIEHFPVNACLAPLCCMHGHAVTTVEGIGSIRSKLHPVQRQIAENHGSQCGFCTPGIVMSMYTLLRNKPHPTRQEIQETFDGNLCRCTGYRPILEGFNAFARSPCSLGDACCQNRSQNENCCTKNNCDNHGSTEEAGSQRQDAVMNGCVETGHVINGEKENCLYDPSMEPIFPPELKLRSARLHSENLRFQSDRVTWLSPSCLTELLSLRKSFPESKLVCGNSEIGIETKFKKVLYPVLISVSRVAELMQVTHTGSGLRIGASLPLSKVNDAFKAVVQNMPEHKTRVFAAFIEMLKWFAGHQIRSVACIAGNIMTASPISDLNPLLLACKAVLEVSDPDGNIREVVMDENFFTGYRQTCLNKTDTLLSVTVPFTRPDEYFFGYKQANRKDDDIAIVNAGMRVDLGNSGTHVRDITLAFGGMSIKTIVATKTMKALRGRQWDDSLLETACSSEMLPAELPLEPGSPGGMVAYRRTLTLSFFFRFYTSVTHRLQQSQALTDWSAETDIPQGVSSGSQIYQMPSDLQPSHDMIGQPIVHKSAYKQSTGEAEYVDDILVMDGELFAGFVLSTKAHAKILCVDPTEALKVPGVVDFVSFDDIPGRNNWGVEDHLFANDMVFAHDKVVHDGQVVGVVLAESLVTAQRAANLVRVEYQELEPIITIQDAIAKNSYYNFPSQVVECGDIQKGFTEADHVLEGEFHIEAQEHFYLEPHACIVYPHDGSEYHVVCMTQGLDTIQVQTAKVLGIPVNKVSVSVRRIGGGFGGKESRHCSIVLPAAVAAYKTQRPVRAVLDRYEDMRLTGTRHPILAKYKVGFTDEGQLIALEVTVYVNCGMSEDLSYAVAERYLLTLGNFYKVPNTYLTSVFCKTNISSCTAFRGFGAPQAVGTMETIIENISCFLGIPQEKVRVMNFYKEGDITAYGQVVQQSNLLQCWNQCAKQSNYFSRLQKVQEYNRLNRWKKRGIALAPLTYGVGFTIKSMNQGSALVNIYNDGSVIMILSGVEMGQGLHTKMIQVASRALGISDSYIHVAENATNSVPNTMPTAASMTSDLVGMAVVKACEELKTRMEPFRTPKKKWEEAVLEAIEDRICLSAVGYYTPDTPGMDWSKKVNSPFFYFSYGACCSEVEIDCLTGDHQVLRTDIVMDVGHSLNPVLDIGQIEGAFIQGYGLLILEQYKMSSQGKLFTTGPGTYKIPAFSSIPQVFNVTLIKNKGNPTAVYSSKAIGEPPLCLAISVFLAIRSAITAARLDAGHKEFFQLDSPATPDKIRMACLDQFSEQFLTDDQKDSAKPWFVKL